MRKVEDDITLISMLVTECHSECQLTGDRLIAAAKFSFWQSSGSQTFTLASYAGFFSDECQAEPKGFTPQPDFDLPYWPDQPGMPTISVGRSDWRFDLTTCSVNYCTPKAEKSKNLKQKNIPNHVSNNCLVPTYK